MKKSSIAIFALFLLIFLVPSFTYAGSIISLNKKNHLVLADMFNTFGINSEGKLLHTGRIPYNRIERLLEINN